MNRMKLWMIALSMLCRTAYAQFSLIISALSQYDPYFVPEGVRYDDVVAKDANGFA